MTTTKKVQTYLTHRKWVTKNEAKYRAYHKEYNAREDVKARRRALYRKRIEHYKARDKVHYYKTRDRHRELQMAKRYGISVEKYRSMFVEHDNKCAICCRPESIKGKTLSVDHNHRTGTVRGLLCGHCNRALGYLREDLSLLPAIQSYLEKYETPTP